VFDYFLVFPLEFRFPIVLFCLFFVPKTLQVKRSPSGAEMMSFNAGTGAAFEPIGFVMEMMTA